MQYTTLFYRTRTINVKTFDKEIWNIMMLINNNIEFITRCFQKFRFQAIWLPRGVFHRFFAIKLNQPRQGPTMVTLNFTLVLILALNRVLTSLTLCSILLFLYGRVSRQKIDFALLSFYSWLMCIQRRIKVYNRNKKNMLQLIHS